MSIGFIIVMVFICACVGYGLAYDNENQMVFKVFLYFFCSVSLVMLLAYLLLMEYTQVLFELWTR